MVATIDESAFPKLTPDVSAIAVKFAITICVIVGICSTTACSTEQSATTTNTAVDVSRVTSSTSGTSNKSAEEEFATARQKLVDETIAPAGVRDAKVLDAMRKVPRHKFVPQEIVALSYEDRPLTIGHRQTISQPSLVAYMTAVLTLKPTDRVLEIGTGSGYQAAILSLLAGEVYTIEIVDPLAKSSAKLLKELGHSNVTVRSGDGYGGWPEKAPFDAIMLTAAPDKIPQPLIDQLAVGGRLLAPVGSGSQKLILLTKSAKGVKEETLIPVIFVPMTGEAQK
jgi:protein-L-isoaspartate(D-aspartate) O-methyltransferase